MSFPNGPPVNVTGDDVDAVDGVVTPTRHQSAPASPLRTRTPSPSDRDAFKAVVQDLKQEAAATAASAKHDADAAHDDAHDGTADAHAHVHPAPLVGSTLDLASIMAAQQASLAAQQASFLAAIQLMNQSNQEMMGALITQREKTSPGQNSRARSKTPSSKTSSKSTDEKPADDVKLAAASDASVGSVSSASSLAPEDIANNRLIDAANAADAAADDRERQPRRSRSSQRTSKTKSEPRSKSSPPSSPKTRASVKEPSPSPYGSPYFLNRSSRGPSSNISGTPSRYPGAVPLSSSSGGMSRPSPGTAASFHEISTAGTVNWMVTEKGPYGGGIQKTFKHFSFNLSSDGFDDFFRFYNGIITQLSIASYHRRLLPPLDLIAGDADLTRSPVDSSCMPLAGTHCLTEWSQSAYWDDQHLHLSQLIYLTLTSKDVVKTSAPITLGIINRYSQFSDGFGVLQAMVRRHHPRVTLGTAPTYDQCLALRPTLVLAKGSHPAYLSLFERWLDRMRLHIEFGIMQKPSQFSLWFIQGLSLPLQNLLRTQELNLKRFQAQHRATTVEPDLPPETAILELGLLLDVFAPESSAVTALVDTNSVNAGIHQPPATPGISAITGQEPLLLEDDTDLTLYEHHVAAFGGQGNRQGKRPSRSTQPSVPCPHKPCRGRSHPPDLCCICFSPHPWTRCWHIMGLPETASTRRDEFKAMAARGDGATAPPTPRVSAINASRVTFDDPPASPAELVDDDVLDIHRAMILREAPASGSEYMLKTNASFVSGIFSFVATVDTTPLPPPLHMAVPSDDADVEESIQADGPDNVVPLEAPSPPATDLLSSEHRTSAEPDHAARAGFAWWHVDTGATDVCTNRLMDLLAPIPTNQPCGTAATGATGTIEALGGMTLSGTTVDGLDWMVAFPQVLGVPGFQRRSLSLHALRALGYQAYHNVGEYILLIHLGSKTRYKFAVTTMHDNTDFVQLKINAIATLPAPICRVSAINLAARFKGPALFYLLHFRYGCLAPNLLEVLIKSGRLTGVNTSMKTPDDFQCPVCLVANARRTGSNPGTDHVISIKGARLHADFLFPKVTSVRGYVAILLIIEPVTSHGWIFLRRSKHPPLQMVIWFITHLRLRLGMSCTSLRTDGGGELYGSHAFRAGLAQIHCQTETTGGYNPSANGPPETAGGLIKRTMRCLLVMGSQEPNMWCFAAPFSQTLENIRPRRKENYRSSHESAYGKAPSYDHMRMLFSTVYILVSRASRRRQDPLRRANPGTFLGFQGTGRVLIYKDDTQKGYRYAHHTVIDELQSAMEPGNRSVGARFLHNLPLNIPFRDDLATAVADLEITPSRWSHDTLTSESLPGLGPNGELGLLLSYSDTYSRCKITGIQPDSPASVHLLLRNVANRFLLAINGATVRTAADVIATLKSIHSIDQALSGILLLLAQPNAVDRIPEDRSFVPVDGSSHRAVWSIAHPKSSVLACPSSFKACMKGPHRPAWLAALFKHLDSNQGYGTFAAPCIPPPGACVLDAILAIKHKTDEYNRLVERKLRLCAHGGQQIAGVDYDESYAPAILATSFRLCIVMACHLGLWLWHLDVSNAFQSTPDPDGKTFLRCFPEYLLWFADRFPAQHAAFLVEHPDTPAHELAVLMLKYVQGRVDASLKWKHAIEDVLIGELGLTPNRADSCVYSGRIQGDPIFIARATDDFLCGTTKKGYLAVLHTLRFNPDGSKRWIIHDYGLATYFFGIRIVQSTDAITIDQRPFTRATLAEVFGPNWEVQPPGPSKHKTPLPAGSAYEAKLAGEIPASPSELRSLEHRYGYKYRTILGKFSQLSSWTRLDITTGTTRLSQYQSSPGPLHFDGLQKQCLFLLAHPDRGLTYTRKNAILPLEPHPDCPLSTGDESWPTNGPAQYPPPGFTAPPVTPSVAAFSTTVPVPLAVTDATALPFAFDYDLSQADGLGDPIAMSHEPTPVDEAYCYGTIDRMALPRVASVDSSGDATACESSPPVTILTPPPIEGEMDANHGSVFETIGFTGLVLLSMGTAFFFLSQKQATAAYNTAESELYAATTGAKTVKWIRVWVEDFGTPILAPVPMGEDNEAARLIAHAGKLTRNVRHIAIQTSELQQMVKQGILALLRVGSADNRADHFTKLLAPGPFLLHTAYMMGLRFITAHHAAAIGRRNIGKK